MTYINMYNILNVIYEGYSFQIKIVFFPLLDNYRRSYRTFGPHWYGAIFKLVLSKFDEIVVMFYKLVC